MATRKTTKPVKNKYGVKMGDLFCYSGDTSAEYYQVIGLTEGGVYVKRINTRLGRFAGGHDKVLVPSLNEFWDSNPPIYKKVMPDKYSVGSDPYPLFKKYYIVINSAYGIKAWLLKDRFKTAGIQVTDSQFW